MRSERGPGRSSEEEHVLNLGGKVSMELALVPAGSFQMGSPENERDTAQRRLDAVGITAKGFGDEGPRHEVTISRPFHMSVCEVTRGQFAAFVGDSGYQTEAEREGCSFAWDGSKWDKVDGATWRRPGFDQDDDHPVVCVSHNDAVAFCGWLSGKTGKVAKLPTEAQWEYACRAGTATAYPWGDDPDDGRGWCNAADQAARKQIDVKLSFNWDDGYVFTAPVGKFRPNAFGIYDMLGNAWEWCSDWYDTDYYASGNSTDPQGPGLGTLRVVRGGSWGNGPQFCRSAFRDWAEPSRRSYRIGLRVTLGRKRE
jgi:formylglycine-generating enzyme required for sulfatase activity